MENNKINREIQDRLYRASSDMSILEPEALIKELKEIIELVKKNNPKKEESKK